MHGLKPCDNCRSVHASVNGISGITVCLQCGKWFMLDERLTWIEDEETP